MASLGHEVFISAFWGLSGASTEWNGHLVLPGGQDPYGSDIIASHARYVKADLVITLMDVWPLDAGQVRSIRADHGIPVAHWMPVDCDPLSVMDERHLKATGAIPVAMSRFGQAKLAEAGLDALYVPHGIETSVFTPDRRDEARKALGLEGRFAIGINAANKDAIRKGFPEQLLAFARFRKRHPEAMLMLHSAITAPGALDLNGICARLGISDAVRFADQYAYMTGMLPPAAMAGWMSAADLGSNCAYGEGFGLANVEFQSSGTPVAVTDATAMSELAGPGWKVAGEPFWNSAHAAWWTRPSPAAIEAAYEEAFTEAAGRRDASREFALAYDADRVLQEHWKPALEAIMERAESGRTVTAGGLKWRVGDAQDHGDRLGPYHEENVTDEVLSRIPEGGVFLDVGAHVGHYTVRAAKTASKVIAVEPNPETAARLRDNLALNGIGNVQVAEVAAWDRAEPLALESPVPGSGRDGGTRVAASGAGTVMGIPLDDVLAAEPRIDLVKLDVEGADLRALAGMRKTLERLRPVLVIEDHSVYGCYERADLDALMAGMGYSVRGLAMYGCAPYLLAEPSVAGEPAGLPEAA